MVVTQWCACIMRAVQYMHTPTTKGHHMLKLKYIGGVLHVQAHAGRGGWVPWAAAEVITEAPARLRVPCKGKRPPLPAVARAQRARWAVR